MALTDPQVITINAVPNSLARIESSGLKSKYSTADGLLKLTISHQPSKGRARRMARIDFRVIAADPLNSVNEYKDGSIYVVFDLPDFGFTTAEVQLKAAGFKTWLTDAIIASMIGNQS